MVQIPDWECKQKLQEMTEDIATAERFLGPPLKENTQMTDQQIKYMRDRFLSWTLPENLNPDGGISYKRSESAIKYNHPGPVGTNFLDAEQAEAMVRHMVEGLPE